MKAKIEIECKRPKIVARALGPEASDTKKFTAKIKATEKSLLIEIDSDDISGLLAGINSHVTLARASINSTGE